MSIVINVRECGFEYTEMHHLPIYRLKRDHDNFKHYVKTKHISLKPIKKLF